MYMDARSADFQFMRRSAYALTDPIQLLEPGVADAQHFFGTPSVTIVFGRIF